MIGKILLWGLVVGVIHFFVVGALYMNPLVAKLYKSEEDNSAVKKWPNQKKYILSMFLGTQVEIYIITTSYLYLRSLFADPASWGVALILAGVFTLIRVYPRFWNMWIQSTYPGKLLAVELVNGTLSTFVIVIALKLLPA